MDNGNGKEHNIFKIEQVKKFGGGGGGVLFPTEFMHGTPPAPPPTLLSYFVDCSLQLLSLSPTPHSIFPTRFPSVHRTVPLILAHTVCSQNKVCAGVTRRFHKTTFRGFFSERELVDFLHILWRHFWQLLLRTWKRILFDRNKLTKFVEENVLWIPASGMMDQRVYYERSGKSKLPSIECFFSFCVCKLYIATYINLRKWKI